MFYEKTVRSHGYFPKEFLIQIGWKLKKKYKLDCMAKLHESNVYPFVHLCDRLSSLLLVVRSKEFLGIFMFVVVVVCSSFGKKIEDPVASYITDGR